MMRSALAPNCYVCRLMADSMKHSGKDDVFVVAFVTGYAEGRTQGVIDWVVPDTCERHHRKFMKAMASVSSQLREKENRQ